MSELTRARRNMKYGQAHELGAQMRRYRKAAGLTLIDMSERLGKPKSTLADAETGEVMPSLKLLEAYELSLALPTGTLVNQPESLMSIIHAKPSYISLDHIDDNALDVVPLRTPRKPVVIDDAVRCRELMISLLRTKPKAKENGEVQPPRNIALMMGDPPAHFSEDLRQQWFQALAKAVQQKDRITHIYSLPSSSKDSQIMIQHMLYLIKGAEIFGGQYNVLYLPEAVSVPYELFIVSHQAAIELFRKFQGSYTDSATFYPYTTRPDRPDFVQHYSRCFDQLRDMAEPLLRTYPVKGSAEFDRVILEAELREGEEILAVEPMSDKTMPLSVRRARTERILKAVNNAETEIWLPASCEVIAERRLRFEERVQRWAVRHILYCDVLNDMINQNIFRDSTADEFQEKAALHPEEIRACIQQLISDLESFENYKVALIDKRPQGDHQIYWEVVADTVLFVFANPSKSLLHVSTQHKQIVQLQRNYFALLWESIPEEQKRKDDVIRFLQGLLGK